MRFLIPALALLLVFSSCNPARRAVRRGEAQNRNLPEIVVSGSDPRYTYRATTPLVWDITHTRVALSFNWLEKTADGEVWIDAHPYAQAQDTLVLDAKGMSIMAVELVAQGTATARPYVYENSKLAIALGRRYLPSEQIQVHVRYKAMPYGSGSGGSAAITDDRGLYFINTDGKVPGKPRQIWTQGETEANAHWLPTIDKPNERFTVQVELLVPDTMQTLGNGLLVRSEPAGNGLRRDVWKMDKEIQPYAVMLAIGRYAIVKDAWKDKEVSYYVEPEYERYARKMFQHTPEMMDFFSAITGVPFPWQKYAQVVVRDYVSGAMENTSASLFGEFMNQDFREMADENNENIVSHELFHQWFGDYVTQESWSNLTVSESFANYGEQLWRNFKYGKESADELAYADKQKYLSAHRGKSPALVRFYYSDKEDMFDRISYEKGGAVLHYLHGLLGDELFYKAMKIYLTRNALTAVEATHWRLAVEEATGQDWNWFFNQFYLAGGHPNLDIKYTYDDKGQKLYAEVSVVPTDTSVRYRLPLESVVVYAGEKVTVSWQLEQKKEVFTYPYRNGVKPVIVVDTRDWLPGTVKENKTMEQWLTQYNAVETYAARRAAIDAALRNIEDNSSRKIIDNALLGRSDLLKEYTLASLAEQKANHAARWGKTVESLAEAAEPNRVRAEALRLLGHWQVYAAKEKMLAAVSDSSYRVAGAALLALNRIADDTAYSIARILLSQPVKAEQKEAVEELVAAKGNAGDIEYFEQKAQQVYGREKLAFGYRLSSYLVAVNELSAFYRALDVLSGLGKGEEIKGYRRYITTLLINTSRSFGRNALDNAVKRNRVKRAVEELILLETDEESKKSLRKLADEVFAEKK